MTCWIELDLLKGEHLCVCRGFLGFHSVLIEHRKWLGGWGQGSLAGPCEIPSEGVLPSTQPVWGELHAGCTWSSRFLDGSASVSRHHRQQAAGQLLPLGPSSVNLKPLARQFPPDPRIIPKCP